MELKFSNLAMKDRYKAAVARFNNKDMPLLYQDPHYGRAIAWTFSDEGRDKDQYAEICFRLKVSTASGLL